MFKWNSMHAYIDTIIIINIIIAIIIDKAGHSSRQFGAGSSGLQSAASQRNPIAGTACNYYSCEHKKTVRLIFKSDTIHNICILIWSCEWWRPGFNIITSHSLSINKYVIIVIGVYKWLKSEKANCIIYQNDAKASTL